MVVFVGAVCMRRSGMFGRSFDSWRQEGNEWCRLGSLADRKDSIGWENAQNVYDDHVQHSAPVSQTHLKRPIQERLCSVDGDDGGRELECRMMLGSMHPESLTFSGGQFREGLKV